MNQLFDGEIAPLTYAWGFLEAPIAQVVEALVYWRRRNVSGVQTAGASGTLRQLLRYLEPLTTMGSRELVCETPSSWTAYFDNTCRGGDPSTPVSYLARQLRCRGVAVHCVSATLGTRPEKHKKGTFGSVQFALFAPEQREFLNYERSMAAANDGGKWVFYASGTPQPFEEPERYKERRIRARFTDEMLERYCAALGISLFDEHFYGPSGFLVTVPLP